MKPEYGSEVELFELCARGDADAWRELIGRYQALVYSVPRRMGLSPEDSADVFQRVCVLLYSRLGGIREPERLGGWLLTTASREALRVARSRAYHVSLDAPRAASDDGEVPALDLPDVRPLADALVSDLERAQILRSALAEMPERCRAILAEFLDETGEGSYRDVARRLGIPIGSIGPTRARCFALLRDKLRARGIER